MGAHGIHRLWVWVVWWVGNHGPTNTILSSLEVVAADRDLGALIGVFCPDKKNVSILQKQGFQA